ncbi:ABC transporter substrate-binding protein [Halomonas sp. 328]|uniref:ABC transporter substrate-binding protein n=1 Tax=Halomonas sp. 328 TaxID=2776704 RepID=UPI0018A78F38|nr:ABC transporter substrate-binding protein [Halomonas sp. 328]MBF8224411.1 ABC transporter substrate-binding protein [Halomonas sp. 328]
MQRREVIKALGCLAAMPVMLGGCHGQQSLRLGIHPWPGYEPLYLAEAFGWLPLRVELAESSNAGGSLAALLRGELDGAALTLDEVLQARAAGLPLTCVAVLNESVGADMVVARAPLASLAALAGKRLAVERSALGELVLSQLLETSGLERDQLTLIDLPPDRQPAAWRAGHIDAAITYEPSASRLLRDGAVRVFDSSQFPDLILDVLALRLDRLPWRGAVASALVEGHFRGLKHLKQSPGDALRRIGAWRDLSLEEAQGTFAGLELPGVVANRAYLAPSGAVMEAADHLNRLMVARGLLTSPADLEALVTSRYLPVREE